MQGREKFILHCYRGLTTCKALLDAVWLCKTYVCMVPYKCYFKI